MDLLEHNRLILEQGQLLLLNHGKNFAENRKQVTLIAFQCKLTRFISV
jgi:hypothetical protein